MNNDGPQVNMFSSEELLNRVGNDKELADEILAAYLKLLPDLKDKMERSIQKNDTHSVFKAAHTLNGASANVAATAIRNIACDIEKAGKQEDIDSINRLFMSLNNKIQETEREIKSFLQMTNE
jgi:HPt (histidine-containing phosphotransfer) domain-containing protein